MVRHTMNSPPLAQVVRSVDASVYADVGVDAGDGASLVA